uniref:Uncharacterized protein n=1 Tax=Anguilla anguilla TaxID=7936 RepID=A0A0E9QPH3_ANGAN
MFKMVNFPIREEVGEGKAMV